MSKRTTDLLAIAALIAAIVTGFMLHNDVHHQYVYDNTLLWTLHEVAGLLLVALLAIHGMQHPAWFRNYVKIPVGKKRVTTILLVIAVAVFISGIILMCGSHSHFLSIFHYATAILLTIFAIGHIFKRRRLLSALFRKR